jgi:arylsulfatase A-like enzyme
MPDARPNVLLINSHDTGRFLGCYGVNTVRTPHLDRLATEGVLLEQCSAASPICSPSRGAMVTGRWPQRNGLVGLVHHGFRLHETERHAAALFRDGGYATTLFHFQHVAEPQAWSQLGFENFLLPSRDEEEPVYPHMARPAAEVGDGVADWLARQAARTNLADRPFFAQVNFNETHTPFWFGGVDPQRLDGVTVPPWIEPSASAEDHFAHLQGSVAALDDGVGRILAALDSTDLAANTLVLFATDHGLEAARDKWTCYESGLGIAALARLPAQGISGGRRLATPLSNVDFLPTLLDCAGLPAPANLDGRSFAPLLRGDQPDLPASARPVFGIYYNGGSRSVRLGRWKLIRNLAAEPYGESAPVSLRGDRGPRLPRPPAQLYDLSTDPHELHDLASRHPEEVARLSALLGRWMLDTGDPAAFVATAPEPALAG